MLYVAAVVIISSFVPTILKYARLKDLDTDYVIFFNYVIAAASSWIVALRSGSVQDFSSIKDSDIRTLFRTVSMPNTFLLVVIVGSISGVLYYAALLLVKSSVVENGMGKTSMFSRLSFIVSLIAAVLIWHEIPSPMSGLGVLLGIVSVILLLNDSQKKNGRKELLILLLLVNGLVEVGNKLFTMYTIDTKYKDMFVAFIYLMALLSCIVALVFHGRDRREKPKLKEAGLGVLLGFPNVVNSLLILRALEVLPAVITFASIASGSVLLSSLIGKYVFRESVRKRQKAAIAVTICGLILMNAG